MSYGTASYGEVSYGQEPGTGPLTSADTLQDILDFPDVIPPGDTLYSRTFADAVALATAVSYEAVYQIFDTMSWADANAYDLASLLVEVITLSDNQNADAMYLEEFYDAFQYNDATYQAFAEMLTDALVASDTNSFVKYWATELQDTLGFGEDDQAQALYSRLIASTLAFADMASHADNGAATESLSLTDQLTGLVTSYQALVDAVIAGDTASFLAFIPAVARDGLDFSVTATAAEMVERALSEGLTFSIWLGNSQSAYVAYAMNPSVGGLTEYTNYRFNSIAKIGANYYGASDTGLYLLEGDTDAGSDIDVRIRMGAFDFGNGYRSRVEQAYLGIRSDGRVVLRVIADDDKERWYETQALHGDLNTQRVKLGKGVNSRYWQFELVNRDGADIELEQIEFLPVTLTRRV